MTPTLYFLRSSENKIVTDMLKYAHPDIENPQIYSQFYGLTSKDLGLYALVENKIAGAIWSRQLKVEDGAKAFIDEKTPVVSFTVLPEFRKQGIGKAMMQQFLLEAATLYDSLTISLSSQKKKREFYEQFGFEMYEKDKTILIKRLQRQEIIRPTDGYDSSKWMD